MSTQQSITGAAPDTSTAAVLKPSEPLPDTAVEVQGLDFDAHNGAPLTVEQLLESYARTGFQASSLATATSIINNMISWRSPTDPAARTTIFLGYTSNLVSSGLREILRYLVQHKHVHAIVTTAGGVEEDIIKCLAPTYLGSFSAAGAALRQRGINRIGNLFVPNDNYCKFEDWVVPIFDRLLDEQERRRADAHARNASGGLTYRDADFEPPFVWTPSTLIERLGLELDDDRSILTWAARNGIPVFCPALTDGSLGDMLYFHSFKASPLEFTLDIRRDIRRINDMAQKAARSGMIVLGGGVVKHHIANANLMRNGAEYAVFVNTGNEFDGSDAGARPDEAISWGKIKAARGATQDQGEDFGEAVKVYADASIVFPMLVAATFARADREKKAAAGA